MMRAVVAQMQDMDLARSVVVKNLKFSLITPTNNPRFLGELYESILAQTYSNWEWIVLANGGADIPAEIVSDPRVKARPSTVSHKRCSSSYIGAIKNDAFSLGEGDILVEIDHDDLITEDCLLELNKAFQDNEVGFVYSDNAKLADDFVPYRSDIGWTHDTYEYKGRNLITMKSPQPNACSLQYIWYAPDHVRAWRRSVYEEIGGHDPSMEVCDDHESADDNKF